MSTVKHKVSDLEAWYRVEKERIGDEYHKKLWEFRNRCAPNHIWSKWTHVNSSSCGVNYWEYVRKCEDCGLTETRKDAPEVDYKIEDVYEDNPLDSFL